MIISGPGLPMVLYRDTITMDRYYDYVVEDFVLDSMFQRWVRYGSLEDNTYWNNFTQNRPLQSDDVGRARALLDAVYRRYATGISDEEINIEIHNLVQRIRKERKEEQAGPAEPVRFPARSRSRLAVWAAAAVVLLASGLSVWFLFQGEKNDDENTYTAFTEGKNLATYVNNSPGNQSHLLEDGSSVILEPGATLSFPVTFQETSREVFLSGTATFEVRKDVERPFIVYSDKLVTRVLGTRFIVRAPLNGETIVEVTEGKVSVFKSADFSHPQKEKMGLILTSNQRIVLQPSEDRLVKELSEIPQIVAPLPPSVTFNYVNTPASKVLRELMDAYHVDIIFDEELLKDCTLSATLSDQTLYEKLTAICEAIEARYELIDGQVMVYGKGCM